MTPLQSPFPNPCSCITVLISSPLSVFVENAYVNCVYKECLFVLLQMKMETNGELCRRR